MRALPHEIALIVLGDDVEDGLFPDPNNAFTREEAHAFLCHLTAEDFGFNEPAWRRWFDVNCRTPSELNRLYATMELRASDRIEE